MSRWDRIRIVAGIIAVVFGLATIVSGGLALFGDMATREAVGAAVPFVLWFNFSAGFAYVLAGTGLLMRTPWSVWLSILVAAATVLVFGGFAVHIQLGGEYEMRTVWAMTLRSLVWIFIAVAARHSITSREA